MWAYEQETMAEINQNHTNERFLPGVVLPAELTASTDPEEVAKDAELMTLSFLPNGYGPRRNFSPRTLRQRRLWSTPEKGWRSKR